MRTIQISHLPALRYPRTSSLPPVSESELAQAESGTFLTFRPLPRRPDQRIKDITACTRLPAVLDDLTLYGVEADSPLAPLLIWDAAHFLPVGKTITMSAMLTGDCYIERDYFRGAFEIEHCGSGQIRFRKVGQLRAETCDGLDRWTFGIPVGPDDPTILNACVARILELDLPHKEILLCGRPHPDFKHYDKVRIVGEDIPAPPVRIAEKKNRLAEEAQYENLCILHDRVFLPSNFAKAIKLFGDRFPFVTLQSLYFDDRYNLSPRRYSDSGIAMRPIDNIRGFSRDQSSITSFAPSVFSQLEATNFSCANALRYSDHRTYATGSLCLAKRDVWRFCPQDRNLSWNEYEDIEHSFRAALTGIPTRINPHTIAQSMTSRPILSLAGRLTVEDMNGRFRVFTAPLFGHPFPRKPLIKQSKTSASARLTAFAQKYLAPNAIGGLSISSAPNSARSWLEAIAYCLNLSRVPRSSTELMSFIDSYEKLILMDQIGYCRRRDIFKQLIERRAGAKPGFHVRNPELINMAAQRPCGSWFYTTLDEYFPRGAMCVVVGSVLAAARLKLRNGRYLYNPRGFRGFLHAVLASTPYSRYSSQ